MVQEDSRIAYERLLHDLAHHRLIDDDSEMRQALLRQTAEELWRVSQAPVKAQDEPAFLL